MGSLGRSWRSRAMQCSLFALLLPGARAWISTSQARFGATIEGIYNESLGLVLDVELTVARQQSLGYRWTLPDNARDNRGLGGSITWAWDKDLCDRMLPLTRDSFWGVSLVNCNTMKETMKRAFEVWAMNHRYIKFTDVSDRCATAGQLNENCTYAEIWVTSFGSRGQTEASFSYQTWPVNFPADFRSTSGQAPFRMFGPHRADRPVAEVQRATIAFQTQGICWYLDSAFCSAMHGTKGVGSAESYAIGVTLWFMLWAVAMFWMAREFFIAMKGTLRMSLMGNKDFVADSGFSQGWEAFVIVLSEHCSPVGLGLRLMLIIFPWPFLVGILNMCWDCFDFEAAAAHEIGHLLGLGSPDLVPGETMPGFPALGQNSYHAGLAAGIPLDASSCLNPWTDVHPGVPPGSSVSLRPSIMEDFTTSNPRSCLTDDDLEALNVLYPDCDGGTTTPLCQEANFNIGTIKVLLYFFVPFCFGLLVAFVFRFGARRYLRWLGGVRSSYPTESDVKTRIDPQKTDVASRSATQSVALTVINE
uniref:Peptidase M10 metallopeptidase domain-containing protein n=1 Tax=Haptolina brevifila TaxID=156173 RepID=A0A7S2HJS0_9EUKA|mmetsp:Transcript_55223/g.109677  ORF Transcript_55223/g.109677 Transcript_55223/m.109677 type:complete len:531 (+) Transcript_55223:1-1593(+)|eukprot:CAMPEP_0174719644 /NCGR_PEP_ID=MMETSP1094-20130205/31610_1 /TAXON_ID=156173 /ORGANISM="Chrysochromulina brevifilum, Strain UTEX LB 985" /LENGTH=530 /DNA_ID=CAMNT_0015919983 /DNA_START=1 /DNA_END=1593 /DNA_ORIENTATION=+